jgi:hypothetical protein
MKFKYLLGVVGLLAASNSAMAFPKIFELEYVNGAWGFQNHGCLVDSQRWVYKFDIRSEVPAHAVKRVSEEDFRTALGFLAAARAGGNYRERRVGADMGRTTWTARVAGEDVRLKTTGDFEGENDTDAARRLVRFLDAWCSTGQ